MAPLVQVGDSPWELRACEATREDVWRIHDMCMQHVDSRTKRSESMRHGKELTYTWHEKRFKAFEYSGIKTINKKTKEPTRNSNWLTSGNLNYHWVLTPNDKARKEPTRHKDWKQNRHEKLNTQGNEEVTTKKHEMRRGTKGWQGGQWLITMLELLAHTHRALFEIWIWVLLPVIAGQLIGKRQGGKRRRRGKHDKEATVGGFTTAIWLWMLVVGMMVGGIVFVMAIKAVGLIGLMGENVGGHLKQAMTQSSKAARIGTEKIKKGVIETKFGSTSKIMFIVILFIQIQGVEGT